MKQNRIDMDQIIEKYYDRIYKYIYNHIDKKDLARDLTQEVFLAMCEQIEREPIEDLQIWLYQVAKKRLALHFRNAYQKMPYCPILPQNTALRVEQNITEVKSNAD